MKILGLFVIVATRQVISFDVSNPTVIQYVCLAFIASLLL